MKLEIEKSPSTSGGRWHLVRTDCPGYPPRQLVRKFETKRSATAVMRLLLHTGTRADVETLVNDEFTKWKRVIADPERAKQATLESLVLLLQHVPRPDDCPPLQELLPC